MTYYKGAADHKSAAPSVPTPPRLAPRPLQPAVEAKARPNEYPKMVYKRVITKDDKGAVVKDELLNQTVANPAELKTHIADGWKQAPY